MRLDISAMVKDKIGTFARPMPPEVLSFFKKDMEKGPFTIMLDLDELRRSKQPFRYLQVVVNFNKETLPNGDEVLFISQMGLPGALVPVEAIAGPRASYAYEQDRRKQEQHEEGQS